MTDLHGFELIREQEIPEINSKATLYRHVKTGAEVLSMENDDENKVFSVTFATPPADSTGLPHILEHSVLGGSRKYPSKEPFLELVKGSLATFVNAMTFSDKTMYPVASQNTQDFYNLIDVYLDAVFFPNITPETLKQEGWHFEIDEADEKLTYKGVVFNEMKGAYSSPDNLLSKYSESALYPDTIYAHDSGGDPAVIPDLTYENFKRFHETYYHPANARIFFYGDDDPVKRLELLDVYLSAFEPLTVDAAIDTQPSFDTPRKTVAQYDAGDGDDAKAFVTVGWLLPDPFDTELVMGLSILEYILLGTQAAPLKKALLESGLGEDTAGHGLDDGMRQMNFMTGMRGVKPDDAEKVEPAILNALKQLANDGIETAQVEASLNTIEFRMREFNTGGYPRGLLMNIMTMSTWLYGGDPFEPLAFEGPLSAIKAKIESGESYFENLIQTYLVDNPHRSTVIMMPDGGFTKRRVEDERERLDAAFNKMDEDTVKQVIAEAEDLLRLQNTPDSPEDLAKLPFLSLDDLDKTTRTIPTEIVKVGGVSTLYHDLFTNGIVYLDIGFDLRVLPATYIPYLSVFSKSLLEMGTETEDYVTLTQRIGRKTGGIGTSMLVSEKPAHDDSAAWLFLRSKARPDQLNDLMAILRDLLTTVNFDNRDRFRQIVLTQKARLEASIVPAGHQFIMRRMASQYNASGWLGEKTGGISYLFFLRELAEKIETGWDDVVATLNDIRRLLFNRGRAIINATLDNSDWGGLRGKLEVFVADLPNAEYPSADWQIAEQSISEGFSIPAQVNYVGKAANLYDLGYTHHGSVHVIMKYLGTTWLWNKIRVQGGAYGGFATFDHRSGLLRYASYRDPNLLESLDVYDGTGDFLIDLDLHEDELTKSIIGTIGDVDGYQLPDAKGFSALTRHLIGYTDAMRQRVRDEILGTTAADFKAFGETLKSATKDGLVVVIGSADSLNAANDAQSGLLHIKRVL